MSQKSKAKAALKREHAARQRQMEEAALQRKWEKLTTQTGGFARTAPKVPLKKSNFDNKPRVVRESNLQHISKEGHYERYIVEEAKAKPRLTPEMQERDDKARILAKAKSLRLLPAFNKGADVYHTDEMLKDVLSGANRRRN